MDSIEDDSFEILCTSLSELDRQQSELLNSMNEVRYNCGSLPEFTTTIKDDDAVNTICLINTVELNSLMRKFPKIFKAEIGDYEKDNFIGILKEYCMMKENLKRSNIVIKEHFSVMSSYQRDNKKNREEDLRKIQSLTEEIKMLRYLGVKVQAESDMLRSALGMLNRDNEISFGKLIDEKVQLEDEYQEIRKSVAVLNDTVDAKDSEIDDMKKEISDLNSVINNLKSTIDNHIKMQEESYILRSTLDELNRDREIEISLGKLFDEKVQLENEHLKVCESVAVLNDTVVAKDSEIDDMKKEISDLNSVINNLKSTIDNHIKIQEESYILRSTLDELKRDNEISFRKLFDEKVQLENEHRKVCESVAVLNNTVVAKDSEIEDMKKQNTILDSVINNLKSTIDSRAEQLASLVKNNQESPQQNCEADVQKKKQPQEESLGTIAFTVVKHFILFIICIFILVIAIDVIKK